MIKHKSTIKQEELNGFLASYSVNQDDLMQLIDKGIRQKNESILPMRFAFRGGNYLGCPGKDIYFSIMNGTDVTVLSKSLSQVFPTNPPVDHVAIAACLRYIYGCFDKHGSLLSKKHEQIVSNNDWKLSLPFILALENCFKNNGNDYGLLISYEMKGHRYGDDFVVHNDIYAIDKMLECYHASQSLAKSVGSLKHTFTPFYWAACYLERYDVEKAKEYHWKNLQMMEKYCPDTREGYKSKASHSWKYIMLKSNKKRKTELSRWRKDCSNKCIIKIKV